MRSDSNKHRIAAEKVLQRCLRLATGEEDTRPQQDILVLPGATPLIFNKIPLSQLVDGVYAIVNLLSEDTEPTRVRDSAGRAKSALPEVWDWKNVVEIQPVQKLLQTLLPLLLEVLQSVGEDSFIGDAPLKQCVRAVIDGLKEVGEADPERYNAQKTIQITLSGPVPSVLNFERDIARASRLAYSRLLIEQLNPWGDERSLADCGKGHLFFWSPPLEPSWTGFDVTPELDELCGDTMLLLPDSLPSFTCPKCEELAQKAKQGGGQESSP
jgi:hypothetical protein